MPFPFIPAALGAASLLGGYMGRPKNIDMGAWERMFGPQALAALTNQFMSQFSKSPWARQQQLSAANTGQQVANQYAAMPGARTSGVGQISQALSGGVTGSLEQALQAMLFQQAMQAAQQNLGAKQGVWAQNQQTPSFWQQFGPALSGAASQTLSMLPTGAAKAPTGSNSSYNLGSGLALPMPNYTPQAAPRNMLFTPQDQFSSFFDQFQNRAVGAR